MKRILFFSAALLLGIAFHVTPATVQAGDSFSVRIEYESHERYEDHRKIQVVEVQPYNIDVRLDLDRSTYLVGDEVNLKFRVSEDAYVYLFSEEPCGTVRQIFQNAFDQDNFVQGHRTIRLPDHGYKFVVDGQTGEQRVRAIASSIPLDARDFGGIRSSRINPFPVCPLSFAQIEQRFHSKLESRIRDLHQGGRQYNKSIVVVPDIDLPAYGETTVCFNVIRPVIYEQPIYCPPPVYRHEVRDYYRGNSNRSNNNNHQNNKHYKSPASLSISSGVRGAEVFLDGQYVGTTPLQTSVKPGRYDIEVRKNGYESWYRQSVNLIENRENRYSFSLDRYYSYNNH